jgi:hypothetical protein
MKSEEKLIQRIIARFGSVIDLNKTPEIMIDILRGFHIAGDEPGTPPGDGGLPPGGTPHPGPTSFQDLVRNEDLMRELLKVSRELAQIKKLVAPVAKKPSSAKKIKPAAKSKAKRPSRKR